MSGKDLSTSSRCGIAKVTFRVRCESLGYGETVFMYHGDNSSKVSSTALAFLFYICLHLDGDNFYVTMV